MNELRPATFIPLHKAIRYGEEVKKRLSESCIKIEVAGSIRRRKSPGVKDIEIVCIPKTEMVQANLFEKKEVRVSTFVDQVNKWEAIKGDAALGKYTQRALTKDHTLILDLFIVQEDNFGWQLMLRTGPAKYNQYLILPALKKRGIHSVDGFLVKNGDILPTPDESSVYALLGWTPTAPHLRELALKNQVYNSL